MTKILVIAEHHDGKLNAATAKTVSAAAAISGASIDSVTFTSVMPKMMNVGVHASSRA